MGGEATAPVTNRLPSSTCSARGFLAEPTAVFGRRPVTGAGSHLSIDPSDHFQDDDALLNEPSGREPSPPPSQPGEVWAGAYEDAAKPVTESAGPVAQGTVFANEILQEELAAQSDPVRHIPGSNASVTYVEKLWVPRRLSHWSFPASLVPPESLPRHSLRFANDFSLFLRSLLQMPDGRCDSLPTAELWPMPLPYPEVFQKGARRSGTPLKKAVCLQIAALNWIALSKPKTAPWHIGLGQKQNCKQWDVVQRFLRLSEAWTTFPEIGPSDMGQGASKHEALEEVLNRLEGISSQHERDLGYSKARYQRRTGAESKQPEVVGKMNKDNLEAAQPIVADRIKMSGKPTFDPRPFLDERSLALYEDPVAHACEPWELDVELPTVKVHASHTEKMKLLRKLDNTDRLVIARPSEVREFAANGLFTVVKDLEYDRLILDGRRPNLLQPPLNRWIMSMASASNLLDISLDKDQDLVMAGDDLRDYYYTFLVDHPIWSLAVCVNCTCFFGLASQSFQLESDVESSR